MRNDRWIQPSASGEEWQEQFWHRRVSLIGEGRNVIQQFRCQNVKDPIYKIRCQNKHKNLFEFHDFEDIIPIRNFKEFYVAEYKNVSIRYNLSM